MGTLGFDEYESWIGIMISCLIVVLFYYNYKIVRFFIFDTYDNIRDPQTKQINVL